jgi:uncharacterized protein YndB with AHSA1/START domain
MNRSDPMPNTDTFEVTTPSDREIAVKRIFDAPRHLVFEALTTPDLLKRWLGVHGDWSLVVCEIDLKVGGSFRYVWRNASGDQMGMRGVFREIVRPERIVNTEKFDVPWYPGDATNTTTLVEQAGKTTLTNRILYDSKEVRDGVLRSPMDQGMKAGYDTLAGVLADVLAHDPSR